MDLTNTVGRALAPEREHSVSEADVDKAYVEKVQAGHVGAYDFLVQKYRARLYSMVYHLCGNREDAADLTQDAFIKAFQSIGRFRGKSAFYTWLHRIALNHTLSFLKKNRRRRFFSFENIEEEASSSEIFETLASKLQTERPLLMNELQERLNDSLQKLSEKHRAVVVLHEIEGLDHKEISEITGSTVGTVRSRLHYAKQQLQADLKQYIS